MQRKKIIFGLFCALLIFLAGFILFLSPKTLHPTKSITEKKRIGEIETTLPLPEAWIGDLDGMLERRMVRVLVPYNKMLYFHDKGRERGIVHDAGMELQKWLNRKYGRKSMPITVMFIPSSRQYLLQNLVDGLGDIAAGNLTVTPSRLAIVDFTDPHPKPVNEIVVTGPSAPLLKNVSDLEQVDIYVRKSSSYYEHLVNITEKQNLNFNLIPADEHLEDEDLLEMVNAGLLSLAVVDNHKAKFWAQIFDKISLREDLIINQGGKIAWAVRKNSPRLRSELNEFRKIEGNKKGVANVLLKRYLNSISYLKSATNRNELVKFDQLLELFKKYAEMYDLDALIMMAQGYQESRLDNLDNSVRSRAGAVGIMQLLPSTAQSDPIQIIGVESDPEQNIHAGAKYMRHLLDTYLSDPNLDSTNKLLLGLAAYNAGPGNLRKLRNQAVEMRLDPNIWFNNVEYAAAEIIGRETVQYVNNIYKYYLAYRLVEQQRAYREK
jgi:membrane-bound lytic murein transglycosylase MltF